jgi:hypothetical protein
VGLTRLHGSPAILMIERIQAINLLWDRTENAVKRYQYALKVVESGEKVPIGNRTDRSSSKARKNRLHGPIRVKRSGSVKGVKDGQERQALLAYTFIEAQKKNHRISRMCVGL